MRARRSSYLRTEILLSLLLFPLFAAGCAQRQVWGTPVDQMQSMLEMGDYSTLESIDFPSADPKDALAISPSAPYYLSFAFESLGKEEHAEAMRKLAWERSPRPWKEEAGVLYAEALVGEKSLPEAITVASGVLGLSPPVSQQLAEKARRQLVEALYWARKDDEVLSQAGLLTSPDAEVLLFRAVSSIRLKRSDARDLFIRLFSREKASDLHDRAYIFLAADTQYRAVFSEVEWDLLTAKSHLARGDWEKGIPLMEAVLGRLSPEALADGYLVTELGGTYVSGSREASGAEFMRKLSATLTGKVRIDALEQAGRLYRRVRDYRRGIALLQEAAAAATSPVQEDRIRWPLLDMALKNNPADPNALIGSEAEQWHDPTYFSDLLRDRISTLVAAGKWKELAGLWRAVEKNGPRLVNAQLCYLLGRAVQEGLLSQVPGVSRVDPKDFFLAAAGLDPKGYYGVMSGCMLGKLPDPLARLTPPQSITASARLDELALGFLSFGLTSEGFDRIWDMRDKLSEADLLDAAVRFVQADDFRSSMYLMGVLGRRRDLAKQERLMLYPQPFSGLMKALASEAGVPVTVLYAMIREESFFDPDVVSIAGAVGLSQLMPDTARQVAQKIGIQDPDLTDPAVNLAIGTRHLRDLLRSTASLPRALLAYNAGLSRVRGWERTSGALPNDLLMEAASFEETREYVRKILVSLVTYVSLYESEDPRLAVLSFFELPDRP